MEFFDDDEFGDDVERVTALFWVAMVVVLAVAFVAGFFIGRAWP